MIKILSIAVIEGGFIELEFSNDFKGIFDLNEYLTRHSGSLLNALKDTGYAQSYFLDAGALCWPNGLELSPSRLYELCLHSKAA